MHPVTELVVATWNVLHRVHAENWDEAVPGVAGAEDARIAAISARAAAWFAGGGDALLLQEVSGDQLAGLGAALPESIRLTVLRYPRVPSPRAGTRHRATLRDPGEHLVVACRATLAPERAAAAAFDDDPGKGFLAVARGAAGGAVVVSTHVTFGARLGGQLARLAGLADRARPRPVVVGGDFNADRAAVGAALPADHVLAELPQGALPTRPRSGGGKSTAIDHVLAVRARPLDATVVDAGGLSDHNLVTARIALT